MEKNFPDNKSLIELNDNISPEDLENIPVMKQCLFVLKTLAEADKGLKATAKGYLPRKFVQDFYEKHIREYALIDSTPMKEDDVNKLRKLRFVLKETGLMKKQVGWFSLTKKGRLIYEKNNIYELFKLLFFFFSDTLYWLGGTRYFEKFDFIQTSLIFCLYILKCKVGDFTQGEEIAEIYRKAFPHIVEEIDSKFEFSIFENGFSHLFLKDFAWSFGLVNKRGEEKTFMSSEFHYKTTDLFKRLFVWKI